MDTEPVPERRFLGVVEVDSGSLLIGDPTYSLPNATRHKKGIDYDAVMRLREEPAQHLDDQPVLLIARFGGDGTFPVFGEFDESGELLRVTIEFVGLDEEPEGPE